MREIIRKLLKNSKLVKTRYLNFLYKYDYKRFIEYSSTYNETPAVLAARLRVLIHTIEKGLSLPQVKKNFGHEKILEIIRLYEAYKISPCKEDLSVIELAEGLLAAYIAHCTACGDDIAFIPEKYRNLGKNHNNAGTICVSGGKKLGLDFKEFAVARHSSRQFKDETVDDAIIEQVVELAQTAPSACNRQSVRIFAITNKEKIQRVVRLHGGMRGFSLPSVIFVVASDLSAYLNEGERDTPFVDGGIFLMNMLYSLEYYNLASCPIIWSSEPTNDTILYDIADIPKSFEIVGLIAAGVIPEDGFKAAYSKRKPVADVLKIVK